MNTEELLTLPNILNILLKLGIVLLLIYLTSFLVKKFSILSNNEKLFSFYKKEKLINVIYSHPLTPTTSLHIVEILGRIFLLSSGSQANLLTEFIDKEQINLLKNTPINFNSQSSNKILDIIKKNKITYAFKSSSDKDNGDI